MEGVSEQVKILGQAIVALALGGALGWERQSAGKWAGLRTHMLVCLASMLFIRCAFLLIGEVGAQVQKEYLRTDPVRMLEAIATGVSFICAGTILRDRHLHAPRGLTTAASLLTVATVGVAVAINRYILAVGITLLVLFVLHFVLRLERRSLKAKDQSLITK